jgi:hypothetical protein
MGPNNWKDRKAMQRQWADSTDESSSLSFTILCFLAFCEVDLGQCYSWLVARFYSFLRAKLRFEEKQGRPYNENFNTEHHCGNTAVDVFLPKSQAEELSHQEMVCAFACKVCVAVCGSKGSRGDYPGGSATCQGTRAARSSISSRK